VPRSSGPSAVSVLGEFTAALRLEALPAEVVERAKAHLLYNLACGMADGGASEPACNAVRDLLPPEATLVGGGERVPADAAAFANGARIHARAQDDTHFPSQCHLGAAVIPAVLAVAEREARTGCHALAAIIGGYEVAAVVGEPLVAEVVSRGFRASSIFGTLGAAAAAASLLGLDERGIAGAIANAASLSAGLTETWLAGSSEWVWQLGAAARNGVLAARLAAEGARGAPSALEGDAGLAAAFSDRDLWVSPADWALGQRWRTVEVIYDLAVDVRNDLRSRHNCLLRRSGRDDPAISKYFDLFPNFKSVHQEHNPGASVKGRKHRPIHEIGSPRNRIDPIRRRHG
jgi:2-methylcitrate dehydratase PrpD